MRSPRSFHGFFGEPALSDSELNICWGNADARCTCEKLIEAFGGIGYAVASPRDRAAALGKAIATLTLGPDLRIVRIAR
jgi:hypothetical protein